MREREKREKGKECRKYEGRNVERKGMGEKSVETIYAFQFWKTFLAFKMTSEVKVIKVKYS